LKNVLAYYKAGIVVDLEVAGLAPRRNWNEQLFSQF
jgi:hypothetical protein